MQTFLPYADFKKSAAVLDNRRLGKQRVEAYQILKILFNKAENKKNKKIIPWSNHPAIKMWKKYLFALYDYIVEICLEWKLRNYKDTILKKSTEIIKEFNYIKQIPNWLGNEKLHSSHRSNLLRKDFNFYSKYNWKESTTLEYYWTE